MDEPSLPVCVRKALWKMDGTWPALRSFLLDTRDHAHLDPRPSLRLAFASQECPVDAGDSSVPGHRHRRQFGCFQRGGRAAAAPAAVSAAGAAGCGLVAFTGDRNIPRLA